MARTRRPAPTWPRIRPLRDGAYRWSTYAERLQTAGIAWKVYQEYDNFGDNLLSVFPPFRPCKKDSELYIRGRSWVSEHQEGADRKRSDGEQLVEAFRRDVETGKLPQVSWIVTAADLSEHPEAEPSKGEHVTAKLIEALVDNPEVFAKTLCSSSIMTRAGGFYDHAPPPVPPVGDYRGHSTVPLDGEVKDYGTRARCRSPASIRLGWASGRRPSSSRPGAVAASSARSCSITHRCLQFVEKRFGVAEPNISAWRRSVCGDLMSVFDFAGSDRAASLKLPTTEDFRERVAQSLAGPVNTIPATQTPATQMPGQRPHRPLPYALDVVANVTPERRFAHRDDQPRQRRRDFHRA